MVDVCRPSQERTSSGFNSDGAKGSPAELVDHDPNDLRGIVDRFTVACMQHTCLMATSSLQSNSPMLRSISSERLPALLHFPPRVLQLSLRISISVTPLGHLEK